MNKSRQALNVTVVFACLFSGSLAITEVRTITATGEYRMGDNDTRTDAKRLALLDAKRLALEQAGTYLEGITEVKNLQVSHDELRAYTAGIVEVTEQATEDVMDGKTHVVRVNVIAKIDTATVIRQIDALRKNETVKAELLRAQQEADRLRQERDALQRDMVSAKTKTEADALSQKRRDALTGADVNSLIMQAWVELDRTDQGFAPSSAAGRARSRSLSEQALALAPSEPMAHVLWGILLREEGSLDGAIVEFRKAVSLSRDKAHAHVAYLWLGVTLWAKGDLDGAVATYRAALQLKPDDAGAHYALGLLLKDKGFKKEAVQEFTEFLRLTPDTPTKGERIERVRAWLRDLE